LLENNKLVPSGMVAKAGKTISKMFEWMQANKLMPAGPVLERYLTMPTPDTKPEDLKSEIWIPCQKGTK
jgi:effector-binding domain-containing protein